MDSNSSATLERPGARRQDSEVRGQGAGALVVGFGDSLARAFAEQGRAGYRMADPAKSEAAESLVVFLKPGMTDAERHALDRLGASRPRVVVVVSSWRAALGDQAALASEAYALERFRLCGARLTVFRPGMVIDDRLDRFAAFYPLVPRRLCGCFLPIEELIGAIDNELRAGGNQRERIFALFGANRPWREVLAERRAGGMGSRLLTAVAFVLSWLLLGQLGALVLAMLTRFRPALCRFHVGTLRPRNFRELLEIYNPYNFRHVKIVGYNNGVNHFGHAYPGKTIVSTIHCDRVRMADPDSLKADCGATVRWALDFLARAERELPVVPNYSYVCLGTAFFVPIHGSAADFSTIAETITRAVLYDPSRDRILCVSSDDADFREGVYNLEAPLLVLRLYLRVKPKARYFIRKEEWADPSAGALLEALRDSRAANVEIRKARADAPAVTVCKYYHDAADTAGPVLELPRDALGRLWDRLEENWLTSFLMHASARHLAWHVELFFSADEFARFWETHRQLPLKKIQVRYIRRDGLPHSPFRDHDCVSVDLFMLRRYRLEFEAYLAATFAVVRANPGKHSR